MYHKYQFSIILFIFLQYVYTQCPLKSLIEPCLCIESNSSDNQSILYQTLTEMIPIRQKSIICEHINQSSFDLRSIFLKLSFALITTNQTLLFNDFLLHNTQIDHLPTNLFGNLTFSYLNFYHNPLLTSIDIDAFNNTRNTIEVFRSLNTNLSEKIFPILKQFHNLLFLSMENDSIQSIPDYAFNHTQLRYIWFGDYNKITFQPLVHIGKYPFYHLPNLTALRIVSPLLTTIGKYSLAMNRQFEPIIDNINSMLYLEMSGSMLNASSFSPTSLTRFRNRPVFLRLFYTKIDYLDEKTFQPFLESHPSSLLDVQYSNISRICDYRSLWISEEYCRNVNWRDNRVYGTACCNLYRNKLLMA